MAATMRPTDSIDLLELPPRAYNALYRNNVRDVGELVNLTETEFLRMRGVGVTALEEAKAALAAHGLAMRSTPLPPPDPEDAAEAEWIGRQLDALSQDVRLRAGAEGLFGERTQVERRRRAWPMYRWATKAIEDQMPATTGQGSAFEAYALPGSMELHLDGLNRLARAELGE